ncbi:MAG: hypothetical protein ACR2RF_00320 [Geminicoccaceae bacterium]
MMGGCAPGVDAWVDLTDTPGSITASRAVRGNSGGTALEFAPNAYLDAATADANYLQRDGGNTITGDIGPDGAATRNFGSFANQFLQMDSQRLIVGYKTGAATAEMEDLYAGARGIGGVLGFGSMRGPGTGLIKAGRSSAYYAPCATFGNIFTQGVNQTAEILNYGGGSFVTGSAFASTGVSNTGTARLYMAYNAYGAFLGGYAFTPGSGGTALVRNYGSGSFVWGYATAGANSTQTVESAAGGDGSFTLGRIDGTGSHTVTSTGTGAFTAGQCTGNSPAIHTLSASGNGSFAQGRCLGNTPSGSILATNQGSFAQGRAANYATITSGGRGSFAQGNCQNTGAYITASGNGAFAHGQAVSGSGILASQGGAFACGAALGGNNITASGSASMAFGDSTAGAVTASATNAFQFGVGVNAAANSLQVGQTAALGTGLHFHSGGPPGVPVNGDMWVTAAGAVTIFSGGVACVCTNAVM